MTTSPLAYCPSLLREATVWQGLGQAAGTSLGTASGYIEQARQATTQAACQSALASAVTWIRWAQGTYGGDNRWSDRCACAAAQLDSYAAAVPADAASLQEFQITTLLAFQGVMLQLSEDAAAWGPASMSALEFAVVTGGIFGVLILASWAEVRPVRRGITETRRFGARA